MLSKLIDDFFSTFLPVPAPEPVVEEEFKPAPFDLGSKLKEHGLRLAHFNREDGRTVTVVYRPRQESTHNITVATAICNPTDRYIRKIGNLLAFSRFLVGNKTVLPPVDLPFFAGEMSDYELLEFYFG